MSVSHAIENYLSVAHVYYQVLQHNFTASSFDSACSAHVPASAVVKAVMLRDRHTGEFAMALIPASNRLKLSWLPSRFADMQRFDSSCLESADPHFFYDAIRFELTTLAPHFLDALLERQAAHRR